MNDVYLDILGQQPRINRLYTQLTFCFELPNQCPALQEQIINTLNNGLERLQAGFPWTAGNVVYENGGFKIKSVPDRPQVIVKDYSNDESSVPNWKVLQQAEFPFSMLDESLIAPANTLAVPDAKVAELPVFLLQANFVNGGLLLTINGQHGAMDMAGLAQVIYLFAKACRDKPFTLEELPIGNMDRRNIIPLLEDDGLRSCEQQSGTSPEQVQDRSTGPTANHSWAYFLFSATSLATLKSLATKQLPPNTNSFVSTDDVLTAFTWESIIRARLPRLRQEGNQTEIQTTTTTLSRNVDMRQNLSNLSVPSTYPGFLTESTTHTSTISSLAQEPLGIIASRLRASLLDRDTLIQKIRGQATAISRSSHSSGSSSSRSRAQQQHDSNNAARCNQRTPPSHEIRLSSWSKETLLHNLTFPHPLGKPTTIRRPSFTHGSRPGLVYFLPKTPDGEIAVGVCLSDEDMKRLKNDDTEMEGFGWFGRFIG